MRSKNKGKSDADVSPIGWYLGTYVLRFTQLLEANNDDLDSQFLTWENTVIVRASDLDEAYDKIEGIAKDYSQPYKGGEDGVDVKFAYEGVKELLPIYEDLEDGSEIAWKESNKSLRSIRNEVREKGSFHRYVE